MIYEFELLSFFVGAFIGVLFGIPITTLFMFILLDTVKKWRKL
jgi:uncharacterized membrane protein